MSYHLIFTDAPPLRGGAICYTWIESRNRNPIVPFAMVQPVGDQFASDKVNRG
jgi:hypothetical protein